MIPTTVCLSRLPQMVPIRGRRSYSVLLPGSPASIQLVSMISMAPISKLRNTKKTVQQDYSMHNCYHPLAIQHDCIEESEDGYRQLLENLWREFPHTVSAENGYGSDRDTGLMSYVQKRIAEGLSTPKFVHCTAHIKRNVISRYRGREKMSIRNKAIRSFDLIDR